MTAYVIAEVNITNDSWAREYGEKLRPILARYEGKFIARGKPAGKLEGGRPLPNVLVILEFPSLEKATAWYSDPEYQPLIKLRSVGSTTEITLVEGV
jgi:uncharacterized protein (DUF1330 family)